MTELVVISGKGGTGKTSVVASFAALAGEKVLADCDVDAADLHLILSPQVRERHEFLSGVEAAVRSSDCTGCGRCEELCRFDAIGIAKNTQGVCGEARAVDAIACEGCGVCAHFCPEGAIEMRDTVSGEWYVSETRHGPLVHARLGVAAENSGKLVSVVRGKAREVAMDRGLGLVVIDASPGIGCPVIASLTGTELALVVTEPTLSGLHDMKRVLSLAERMRVERAVCVNKWDLNLDTAHEIEEWCHRERIDVVGLIPYDSSVTRAQVEGVSVVEHNDGAAAGALVQIWGRIEGMLTM
jgi:MinD superfamily P-loop ATPase